MTSDTGKTNTGTADLSAGEARELFVLAQLAAKSVGARADEVDDLGQNVALKLLEKWDTDHVTLARSRGPESWRGYVIQAAKNALTDLRRKNGRAADRDRRATVGTDGEPLPMRPGVHRSTPVAQSDVDAYLARLAVLDSIAEADLTERERSVLSFALMEGDSSIEIAVKLQLSARRVREVRHSGMRKLREHAESIDPDEETPLGS